MPTLTRVIANTYRDSVALMQLSARLAATKGVEQVSVVMATPANLDLLREAGLLRQAVDARASDMLALVQASSIALANQVLDQVERALQAAPSSGPQGSVEQTPPRSIAMARQALPEANLALIAVPGEYAAAEADKALGGGLNVMLFSDNVSLGDEVALKARAAEQGLLVMGPDCGTAIIDGVPLGFANAVRRGPIGCVGASGTGLQQVTTLIDLLGSGVSQAIGTGGRDLAEQVGGRTMLAGLRLLAADRDTKVIVLVAKPPHPDVARSVLAAAAKVRKPVVVCFIGAADDELPGKNLHRAATLELAAHSAVALASGEPVPKAVRAAPVRANVALKAGQHFIRGLYSGGTFCYEAAMLLDRALDPSRDGRIWSNAAVRDEQTLADPWRSAEHTLVDLGDDVFTRGRPHPMIDHRLRNERIVQEAADPAVAVILLDVVLGFGAHADPAAAMLPAIRAAQTRARSARRAIAFVGFICGTEADPQGLAAQSAALRQAGVLLAPSNAQAVALAVRVARIAGRPRNTKGRKR